MGALTLKNFPFILRSWNVKNYDSIDPTDSFGQDIKVYVNKNKIVKIEPQFSNNINNPWLTDKGRQFFDSIFVNNADNTFSSDSSSKNTKQWKSLFFNVQKTFYLFDICNFKNVNKLYCLIVFENLNIENLSFLSLVAEVYSYIKIKRAENVKINSNLESDFLINSATSVPKLTSSSLCLLIGINTRYEGSHLNLKLRKRYLKGSFKLFSINSLFDLTFPVSFLGSNAYSFKTIVEGNHVICKDLSNSINPLIITNIEVFKNKGLQELFSYFRVLRYSNVLNKVWNGLNVLNPSLYEAGCHNLAQFSFLSLKDLLSFSFFYIINVNLNNVANFKKVLLSRIINYRSLSRPNKNSTLIVIQNLGTLSNDSKIFRNFLYFPTNGFFGEKETFLNTEGLIKRTSKIVSEKNVKSNWQFLRKFVKNLELVSALNPLKKTFNVISYTNIKLFDFKNFVGFLFYAGKTLTNLNFYLDKKNQKISIFKKCYRFKFFSLKLSNNKLKYWLDDFYNGGKDNFCSNSLILIKCSLGNKLQFTNFF